MLQRLVVMTLLASPFLSARPAAAQSASVPSDLRALHERVVYATVRIETRTARGSGWLLQQSGRPLVVTNHHVASTLRVGETARVFFYGGATSPEIAVQARAFHHARDFDLGLLQLQGDAPASARPVALRTTTTVVRGERVVLGGNPSTGGAAVLPFQTTEGVVTGHVSGDLYNQCGPRRNCVVVDAASFAGSSGGPAFNAEGRLVGMLWGGPTQNGGAGQNPTFSYLIHTRTIAAELARLQRR